MIACVRGCTSSDRHLDACEDPAACGGCLPRPAAVGLLVCERDRAGASDALRALPGLWVDVRDAGVLRAPQRGASGSSSPIPLDGPGAEWRERTKALLVAWCKVLEEDFGMSLQGAEDDVTWMARRVSAHLERLLAHPDHADQLVADLCGWTEDDGTRHEGVEREGRRLAFRGRGGRGITLQCPSCPERVRLDLQAEWIECRCGEGGVPSWWKDQAAPPMEVMIGPDVIAYLKQQHRVTLAEVTLRQWVSRGKLTTKGRDDMGRTLYDAVDVAVVAITRREMTA